MMSQIATRLLSPVRTLTQIGDLKKGFYIYDNFDSWGCQRHLALCSRKGPYRVGRKGNAGPAPHSGAFRQRPAFARRAYVRLPAYHDRDGESGDYLKSWRCRPCALRL